MTDASLILMCLLPLLSGVAASGSCDKALMTNTFKQDQLPYPVIEYLQDEEFWVPLITKDDASGITSIKTTFESLSRKYTIVASSSIVSSEGKMSKTSATYAELTENSISVKESHETHTVYSFICSDKLIGFSSCKDGTNGKTHLFAIAKTINPASDLKGDLDTCRNKMKAIDSSAQIVELSYP